MSRTPRIHFTGLALAVTAGLLATSLWTRASVAPLTRETLAASFDVGIRNLVIEWDVNDPRPAAERRKALFDFMYQTFQASAWIPQSLFDSKAHSTPWFRRSSSEAIDAITSSNRGTDPMIMPVIAS
jgi:hypothetical protein